MVPGLVDDDGVVVPGPVLPRCWMTEVVVQIGRAHV